RDRPLLPPLLARYSPCAKLSLAVLRPSLRLPRRRNSLSTREEQRGRRRERRQAFLFLGACRRRTFFATLLSLPASTGLALHILHHPVRPQQGGHRFASALSDRMP